MGARIASRVKPAIVHRARRLLIVLLAALSFYCAWQGGWIASAHFFAYRSNDPLALFLGALLLLPAWGSLLASWRLAAPLTGTQSQGCGFFMPLLLVLPLVWVASLWRAGT